MHDVWAMGGGRGAPGRAAPGSFETRLAIIGLLGLAWGIGSPCHACMPTSIENGNKPFPSCSWQQTEVRLLELGAVVPNLFTLDFPWEFFLLLLLL